jgi:transcriptional regulator with XRE-family HTH domain
VITLYGEILKTLRIRKGLTQQQLAEILGFKSASAVGMLEREERELSIDTIFRITNYFNVSSDYLMGLVPFKDETEAYHSISIAAVKYLQENPLKFPYGLQIYTAHARTHDSKVDAEIKTYCDDLLSKYESKLYLTELELFELSNILFLSIKWQPDFNGLVHFEGFHGKSFSITLDFSKIDKITLDLSKSIFVNYQSGNNTFVKYTSVLNTKSNESDSSERVSEAAEEPANHDLSNLDLIDKRFNEVNILEDFEEAEYALKFILSQPVLAAYGGYDLKNMSDEEIIEIANDMLFAMRLSLEKLKKKHK